MGEQSEVQRTWEAPGMERRDFESWEEFGEYMAEYQQRTSQVRTRTFLLVAGVTPPQSACVLTVRPPLRLIDRCLQVFTKRTTTPVKTRNHVLAAIAVSGRALPTPLLPERYRDYTRMLQCAHQSSRKATGESGRMHARWNGVQSSECQARVRVAPATKRCNRMLRLMQTVDMRVCLVCGKVNATLQLGGDGKYHIHVTKLHAVHNHPLGEPATATDSEVATATATEPVPATTGATATSATDSVSDSVSTSPAAPTPSRPPRAPAPRAAPRPEPQGAAKRRRVGRPPRASASPPPAATTASQVPTMTDVRQFLERVERVRSQQRGLVQSVEERLASYVNEFAAQDGNVAKIFVDGQCLDVYVPFLFCRIVYGSGKQKVLSSITLQTKHMRQVFEAFPEVLRVDATSATSASGSSYRIFSLQAHDTFGNWQYVQHAIVENDRSETLRAALTQFKTHNESHARVRALLVADGDSPELPELCACFPTARVLYSQFHVVRALHEAIAGLDIRGPELTSWHRDRLTGIVHLLVYAPTSIAYGANVAIMMDVLGSKKHPFFRLFLTKFDAWRDRWSTFAREGVTTFSVSERGDQFTDTWRAIFAAANDDLALDDTVAAVRYYQAVVERAFMRDLHRATNGLAQPPTDDDEFDAEMRLLAATVSPAACQLVLPQYHYAISRARYQFCEPARGSFFISAVAPNDAFSDEPSKEFCVEAERGWQCSCAFMVNHHLPCRHVFYIRRVVRCSSVIPVELLEPRWVLAKAQRYFDAARGSGEPVRGLLHEAGLEQEDEPEQYLTTAPPPGAWQKYMAALGVGKRIGQRMMEMPPAEFERAIRFYQLVEKTMNVRPFDVNSPAMARLNSDGHLTQERPAARANWAEPDATRPLTPRGTTAGTVYVSANDHAAALRNVQPARAAAPMWPTTSSAGPAEVIDLQDESEEEEEEEEQRQETADQGDDGEKEHGNEEGERETEEVEGEREPEVQEEKAKKRKADDDDEYEPEEEDEDEEEDEEDEDEVEVEEQRVTRSRSSVDSIQEETWEEEDVEVDVEEDVEEDIDEPGEKESGGESPQKRVLRPRQVALVSDGD
ncbi:hypothetical protein BBJ28_00012019 [Nothophytophthora sp. Chile5]|nr:hypothetical protein BBJ28_00012019 [Nothophytophthora sp. Chile5]